MTSAGVLVMSEERKISNNTLNFHDYINKNPLLHRKTSLNERSIHYPNSVQIQRQLTPTPLSYNERNDPHTYTLDTVTQSAIFKNYKLESTPLITSVGRVSELSSENNNSFLPQIHNLPKKNSEQRRYSKTKFKRGFK